MAVKNYVNKLLKSEYLSNISIQVVGTGLAQLIPLLIMPFLSRAYQEQDFAMYTSFMAVVSVLSVAVGARYQYAIVLPKDDKEGQDIFILSVFSTIIYCAIIAAIILPIFKVFSAGLDNIQWHSILIPLYILLYGIWLSLINLSIRHKKFRVIAFAKITQAVGNSISSLGLGLANISVGLIIGKILGVLGSLFFLTKKMTLKSLKINIPDLKHVAKKYKDFPLYTIFPSFLDTASLQAPVFLIGEYYAEQELGFYGLTFMAIAGPLSIIGVSFKDVFYQKVTEMYNNKEYLKVKKIFKSSALSLLLIGIPILVVLAIFGEPLFKFIFGSNWGESGKYASILVASFIIKLVVSPLAVIFNVLNKLKTLFMWQTIYFITTFSTLLLSVIVYKVSIITLLKIYLIHELLLYALYFILQYAAIKKLK